MGRGFSAPLKPDAPADKAAADIKTGVKKELEDNWKKLPYYDFHNREKVSRSEVRKYLQPYFVNKDSMPYFWNSMALLVGSKGLAVASPYILKTIVDNMTAVGALDFNSAALGILLFGASRVVSNMF